MSKGRVYVVSGSDFTCFTLQGDEVYVNHGSNNVLALEPC